MEPKKLCKSNTNKMIDGVCSGIAEYINIDPTIIRLIWAFSVVFAGAGIWVYIIAMFIMPRRY